MHQRNPFWLREGQIFFWEGSVDACMVVVVVCGAIILDI